MLDCSVTMAWCFEDEATERSDKVLTSLKKLKAIVPNIWPLEVMNVLRVAERKKRIIAAKSNTFINLLHTLPIQVDGVFDNLFNRQILEIIRKHSISAYDAAYVELAMRYNIPLISFDKRLCKAAEEEGIKLL